MRKKRRRDPDRSGTLARVAGEFARRGISGFDSGDDSADEFESDYDAVLTDCALPGEVSRAFAEYLTVGRPGHEGILVVDRALLAGASRHSSTTARRSIAHDRQKLSKSEGGKQTSHS